MNYSTLQRRGFTFWEVVLVLAIIGILAAILIPVFNRPRENDGNGPRCPSKLKQIMLGIGQYVQDYDEKYPILAISEAAFGWAGTLQPYLKTTQIFQCPSEKTAPQTLSSALGYTDYWFNAKLAGVEDNLVEKHAQTVALGDGNSSDARYHLWKIPSQWPKDPQSPLYRHLDGANFAFADGHVKWFRAGAWKDGLDSGNASNATFRLKPISGEVSQ